MVKRVNLCSGGYDPIHSGHINLINGMSTGLTSDISVVAVNSDKWLQRKKGNNFLTINERITIVANLKSVHSAIEFNDDDDSACDAIQQCLDKYPSAAIHFHNGGDRNSANILETLKFAGNSRVHFIYGTGGNNKANSSSDILTRWATISNTTQRQWGNYTVLDNMPGVKVKKMIVTPGKSLSMQQHEHRSEHWFVASGSGYAEAQYTTESAITRIQLVKDDLLTISKQCWHKLVNDSHDDLVIVEIQHGLTCKESDITRKPDK